MFEVYPCVSIPNRLRQSSKEVRWKPQDMWITVICRGFRGFIMVGRDAASKKTPGISGISNSEPRAELRLGRAHVDAVGASLALAFLRAPPFGLDRLLGAILAHLESPEDLDVRRRGPRLLANFHQLGLAVAPRAVHLVDLELARLPDRKVEDVLYRRVPGLLRRTSPLAPQHHLPQA